MSRLLCLFDRARRHFRSGGRLHRLRPVFDAAESFFFSPREVTTAAPHVRDPLDVKRFMSMVILALAPAVIAAVYFFGLRVLVMILVSYAAGGAVEVAFAVARREEINEGFLVTGLLFPLVLPPALPLWMVALGVVFGVVVGKELFGGTGRNLFNPALVGRCFLLLAYPAEMSKTSWLDPGGGWFGRAGEYAADAVSGATPLVAARAGHLADLGDLFFGATAGCAGETSALALLAGGGFLLLTGVADWRTVAGVLVSFGIMTAALHGGSAHAALWHVLAGGFLLGALFMATDPVTSPQTPGAKWAYGLLIGVATAMIRSLTVYVEGVMFAILLGNTFAPILDEVAIAARLRRLRHER
jgi:Na(+)-translocating NADH:ubiquinone oxidoreductase B subunit